MKVVYISNDGTQFDDECACIDYEWKQKLTDVQFLNKNDQEIEDIFSMDSYFATCKIIVPTDEAAANIREFGGYTGFCAYKDITSCGTWIFNNDGKLLRKENSNA